MSEPRDWINAFVVTGILGITLQGHADDGGKPRCEPPQDGSIIKTVLHAGQGGENLLKPTAWRALEKGIDVKETFSPVTTVQTHGAGGASCSALC